jgi:hypothetical protein
MRKVYGDLVDPIQAVEGVVSNEWFANQEVIDEHLQAFKHLLELQPIFPPPETCFGDGVVIVGGGRFSEGIVIACKLLRKLGNNLPIQIWHRGQELEPLPVALLASIPGVSIHDSLEHAAKFNPARILRGWEQKVHAIVHCGFERVLYLDADAYFVADPQPLLDQLAKAPFVFWSDFESMYKNVRWPAVLPGADTRVPGIQGGQLAIDRKKAWPTLIISHWMNNHSDFYYRHMFGDQDVYRVVLAGQDDSRLWYNIGPAPWLETAFVCPIAGKPIVVHRCQGKLYRHEHIPEGKQTYSAPKWNLPLEKEVFSMFAELLSDIKDSEKTFELIYQKRIWGGNSGPGSNVSKEARPYVDLVNTLIGWSSEQGRPRSVVDLGCGDGSVGMALEGVAYVGVDCTLSNIQKLQTMYPKRAWVHKDFFRERDSLPAGDWALCKDVFHHWPNWMVIEFLEWAVRVRKWKRLICTQDSHQVIGGPDTYLGGYRALSHTMEPLARFQFRHIVSYLHKSVVWLDLEA